jgi:uncharacterized protein involved in cysteine biosynthesis
MNAPPKPSAAAKVEGVATIIKNVVVEIATLQRPVTAAAVATFVLTLIPGVGLTVTEATSILVGVGVIDATLEKIV